MATVLITGANRGLGFEFVRQYARDGWEVLAACRDPKNATRLKELEASNSKIYTLPLDVGDATSIKKLGVILEGKAIDILINNAGIFSGGTFSGSADKVDEGQEFGTLQADEWATVLKINTIAPLLVTEALCAHLERGTGRKIINITSKMGSIASIGPGYIAYRSSKAALNAAMATVAPNLKSRGITIINLHPGWVQTDMGGPQATLTPELSVSTMRKVITNLKLADTGKFYGYDGKIIPW